jgi:heat-inducible transcriptional repressor
VLERPELARLSNELSEKLADKTPGQARRALKLVSEAARPFGSAAIRLLQQAQEQNFAAVTLEGLAQLLSQPEFAQSQKLRPIVEVLEQQPLLARFLAESLASPGVQVIIGAENPLEQMREAALVLTRYGTEEDAWGVLGVLGPTRLPYWRAVPMVRFMAELMDVASGK